MKKRSEESWTLKIVCVSDGLKVPCFSLFLSSFSLSLNFRSSKTFQQHTKQSLSLTIGVTVQPNAEDIKGLARARVCVCRGGRTDRQMMVLAYIRWRFGRTPWITLYIKLRFIPLWTWTSFGRQMYICFNFFFLWLSVCVAGEPFALINELGPSAWNQRRITPVE